MEHVGGSLRVPDDREEPLPERLVEVEALAELGHQEGIEEP